METPRSDHPEAGFESASKFLKGLREVGSARFREAMALKGVGDVEEVNADVTPPFPLTAEDLDEDAEEACA